LQINPNDFFSAQNFKIDLASGCSFDRRVLLLGGFFLNESSPEGPEKNALTTSEFFMKAPFDFDSMQLGKLFFF
jgi:hypothetical protein